VLIINRKDGERFFIGGNICITVVEIDRGCVRIGIEAPPGILILREELLTQQDAKDVLDRIRKGCA
jgi:carbon storage regulator